MDTWLRAPDETHQSADNRPAPFRSPQLPQSVGALHRVIAASYTRSGTVHRPEALPAGERRECLVRKPSSGLGYSFRFPQQSSRCAQAAISSPSVHNEHFDRGVSSTSPGATASHDLNGLLADLFVKVEIVSQPQAFASSRNVSESTSGRSTSIVSYHTDGRFRRPSCSNFIRWSASSSSRLV